MKCPHCSAEIEDNVKFCDFCGKPVQGVAPATVVEPAPKPFDAPEPEPPFVSSEPPAYAPPAQSYTPQAQSYTPPVDPYAPASRGSKVLGFIDADRAGIVSIITGAVGFLLSCIGCGGLFSIFGLIVGILGLKTPDRQKSLIGLVLSALGIIVSLLMVCGLLGYMMFSSGSSSYYYPY